jgi:hypothetical protein
MKRVKRNKEMPIWAGRNEKKQREAAFKQRV